MLELVPAKSILARNKDLRWFGIDYQMNLYRGCCHGCIYCDSRSECYGIEEFDRVRGKKNALALLEEELRHKRKTGVAATGAMSDPYNPYESEAELTRGGLKLLDQYGFGAAVATKSARITRDLDVLKRIQSHSPVLCKITVTTCDDELCRKLEPYPSVTSERMEAVRILSGAGIFTGLLLMPVLPFLEDSLDNLLGIVRLGAENGARFIYRLWSDPAAKSEGILLRSIGKTIPGRKPGSEVSGEIWLQLCLQGKKRQDPGGGFPPCLPEGGDFIFHDGNYQGLPGALRSGADQPVLVRIGPGGRRRRKK